MLFGPISTNNIPAIDIKYETNFLKCLPELLAVYSFEKETHFKQVRHKMHIAL